MIRQKDRLGAILLLRLYLCVVRKKSRYHADPPHGDSGGYWQFADPSPGSLLKSVD